MKYCTNCGATMSDDSMFCTNCGIQLTAEIEQNNSQDSIQNPENYFNKSYGSHDDISNTSTNSDNNGNSRITGYSGSDANAGYINAGNELSNNGHNNNPGNNYAISNTYNNGNNSYNNNGFAVNNGFSNNSGYNNNTGNTGYNNNTGNNGYNNNAGNTGYNNGYNTRYSNNGYNNYGTPNNNYNGNYNSNYNGATNNNYIANSYNNANNYNNVNNINNIPNRTYNPSLSWDIVHTATRKMRTSSTIWMIIAIMQLVCGVPLMCMGYGFVTVFLGVWNIVQSSKLRKLAKAYDFNPAGMVYYFQNQGTIIVVFLVLNIIFGALFGIIGSIYDLCMRNYIVQNRNWLM